MAEHDEARQRLYDALNAVANNSIGDVAMATLLKHAEDVFIAAGYELFLHHGQQHNNDQASSRCYPGCGPAWRNPKELIQ